MIEITYSYAHFSELLICNALGLGKNKECDMVTVCGIMLALHGVIPLLLGSEKALSQYQQCGSIASLPEV